jgi:hypothetical protein
MSKWDFIKGLGPKLGQILKRDDEEYFTGGGASGGVLEKAAEALGVSRRVVSVGKAGLEEDMGDTGGGLVEGEREMRLVKQVWMQEQMKKRFVFA